ncbi:MAG: hypothetical protein QOH00_254 [Gaiellales bacterium]|jgi:hypothetical protein|nr:hypothetical protein [Gaiellales bacterium]
MAAELSLRAEGCRLVLRIDRYAYPTVTSGSDANWLAGEVELIAGQTGAYRATHRVALRTDELAEFRDSLRLLDRSSTGDAHFEHLEEQVGITVRVSAGKRTLSVVVREHVGPELRFQDAEIGESAIRDALAELEAVVAAYPVRGEAYD